MFFKKSSPFIHMWKTDRNFRRIVISYAVSATGDQFTIVALPFMVLQLFNNPMALGLVFATMSLPRGILVLFGGALADRKSTARIIFLAQTANMLLLLSLSVLVFSSKLELWMVYIFALGCGISAAFNTPANSALVMRTIPTEFTGPTLWIMNAIGQTILVVGPSVAGVALALSNAGNNHPRNYALAFLIDAISFAISSLAMKDVVEKKAGDSGAKRDTALQSILAGVRYVWRDARLRVSFIYGSIVLLVVVGPLNVGLPLFAKQIGGGSAAYGTLLSALGGGSVLGSLISVAMPQIRYGTLGKTILLMDAAVAALILALGQTNYVWVAAAIMFMIGAIQAYVQITILNWTQQRINSSMLARAMSVFLFLTFMLAPVSSTTSGWILRHISATVFFTGCGVLFFLIAGFAACATLMPTLTDRLRGARFAA